MDLRDEYKKSMESVSPDREAMDRMKAAVLARIAAGEGEPGIPEEKKKPLPLRRIAYAGGAAAACAVIAVSAATILPNIKKSGGMVSEMESAVSADKYAGGIGGSENAAMDAEEEAVVTTEEAALETEDGQFTEEFGGNKSNPGFFGAATEEISIDSVPDGGADNIPDADSGNYAPEAETTDVPDIPDDSGENPGAGWEGTAEAADSVTSTETAEVNPATGTGESDFWWDETAEAAMTAESAETLEEWLDETTEEWTEEPEEPVFVLSRNGWATYNGQRYELCGENPPAGVVTAVFDSITGERYEVIQSGRLIAVYQSGMLIGVYKK